MFSQDQTRLTQVSIGLLLRCWARSSRFMNFAHSTDAKCPWMTLAIPTYECAMEPSDRCLECGRNLRFFPPYAKRDLILCHASRDEPAERAAPTLSETLSRKATLSELIHCASKRLEYLMSERRADRRLHTICSCSDSNGLRSRSILCCVSRATSGNARDNDMQKCTMLCGSSPRMHRMTRPQTHRAE